MRCTVPASSVCRRLAELSFGGRVGLLDGRVAIVTGASKGIGRVMSRLFAREGAKVVCAARTDALLAETVALIRAAGGDAVAIAADAATEAGAKAIVDAATRAYGRARHAREQRRRRRPDQTGSGLLDRRVVLHGQLVPDERLSLFAVRRARDDRRRTRRHRQHRVDGRSPRASPIASATVQRRRDRSA